MRPPRRDARAAISPTAAPRRPRRAASPRCCRADNLKSLNNRWKNAGGQLAGLRRGNIVEKQRAADDAVLQWARSRPEHRDAVAAYEELRKIVAEDRRVGEREFLIFNTMPTSTSPSPWRARRWNGRSPTRSATRST